MTESEFLEFFRGIAVTLGSDLFAAFNEHPRTFQDKVVRETFLLLRPHHQAVIRSAAEAAAAMGE